MSAPRRPRAGFTLIELLVVIAIIVVLATLLMPALQAYREAARRFQCCNNLMQLGIALQNYETTHEVFPPGVVNPAAAGPIMSISRGYHFGWITQILPYIEQGNVRRHLNDDLDVYSPANSTARAVVIHTLLCPSDPSSGGAGEPSPSSYAACHHDVEAPIAATNHGVFFLNSATRYEDIGDGSANTIFLSEKRLVRGPGLTGLGWASGTRSTVRNTGTPPNNRGSRGPATDDGIVLGDSDRVGPDGFSPVSQLVSSNAALVGGFSSYHSGFVNCAFGDGSVRWIKDSIDPQVYQYLGHRDDGEMISQDLAGFPSR